MTIIPFLLFVVLVTVIAIVTIILVIVAITLTASNYMMMTIIHTITPIDTINIADVVLCSINEELESER